MTGDETNKCDHGKGEHIHPPIYWNSFNQVFQCHKCGQVFVPKSQDPVASNTGKELKFPPCLMCGCKDRRSDNQNQVVCNHCGFELVALEWIDCWAHKRIAELEINNAVAESKIEALYEMHKRKIASLESSLEGMEKRNEELTIELDNEKKLSAYDEIELKQKLKTAEDKLAAVTKEKDDLQKDLTTLMNTGELR